jgi:hypothetical protein
MWRHTFTQAEQDHLLQALNTAGEVKTGQYIAGVCKQLITDVQAYCSATSIAAFVMDSAAACRSAMDQLSEDSTLGLMVKLQRAAHMLSQLIKDLNEHFSWVKEVFERCCSYQMQ